MDENAIRALFRNLETGQADEFFARVADEVQWTVMGTHPLAGTYHGKHDFRAHTFDRLDQLVQGGMRLKVTHVIACGDEAAIELESTSKAKSGKPFDNRYCWVTRFAGDQIVEVRAYLDSVLVQRVIDENEKRPRGPMLERR